MNTSSIPIRDPFILVDRKTRSYYMYAQAGNRPGSGFAGVEAYRSMDLVNWEAPVPVLVLPPDAGINAVWAPEVHAYGGSYYLFVTLTYAKLLPIPRPVADHDWPAMHVRGTHVYRADAPTGPFAPLGKDSMTPPAQMSLDGTLWIEDGKPWMVYCREWVETIDGTMECIRLTDDLDGTIGAPLLLFRASQAPGARTGADVGKITDGCFLHRSADGNLFMIWSTFIPGHDYCVVLARSQSGRLAGPWNEHTLIYTNDGGHGMLFEDLEGRLLLALHQPNHADERLHLYTVESGSGTLKVGAEV